MTCRGCRGDAPTFEITTAFQPIFDLEAREVYAYEALVRGRDGEGAAEVLEQVTDDNRYAFDQACRVAAIRNAVKAGILQTPAKLSINFMPNAVYSPLACIRLTMQTAVECLFPPRRLIFEFTENEKIDTEHTRGIVDAYRGLGFETAIDDFGAGHTGLSLLANLQTDALKLDMALVRGVDSSRARQTVIAGLLRIAAELGMRTIAEGVETEAELHILAKLGVRYVQGYLLARPAVGTLPTVNLGSLPVAAAA